MVKWLFAALGVLSVAGCAFLPGTPVPIATPAAATQAASESSCVYSYAWDQQEGMANTVVVTGQGSVCGSLASGLAHDGYYWAPTSAQALDAPTLAKACSLSSGDSTITVYVIGTDTLGLSESVCASEEANSWTVN